MVGSADYFNTQIAGHTPTGGKATAEAKAEAAKKPVLLGAAALLFLACWPRPLAGRLGR